MKEVYKELETTKKQVECLKEQVKFLANWIYDVAYLQDGMLAKDGRESFKEIKSQ